MQNSQNSVQIIRADHNLTIEVGPRSWRLLNGGGGAAGADTPAALCAGDASGLMCSPVFARARRIPGDGHVTPGDVARVVVGWAPESGNWHLGLLLTPPPDGAPGGGARLRWCGLASWPSGPSEDYSIPARRAGEALANLITRPLHLVPPPAPLAVPLHDTQALQATAPVAPISRPVVAPSRPATPATSPAARPAPALPVLPLADPPYWLDEWQMAAAASGYVWARRTRWSLSTALRVVAFLTMGVLFLLLGAAMQTTSLAKVNPGWLPVLGIVVGALLLVQSVRYARALLTASIVAIDARRREVICKGRTSRRVHWRVPFDAITYVLVTQTPARAQGRASDDGTAPTLQDVWLHVAQGDRFWQVVALEGVEGTSHRWNVVRSRQKQPGRRALHLADYDTPAHHAAQRMADTIGTALWLDIR